jgi:hypothetical protein
MKRRDLLRKAAAASALGLAGCVSGDGGGGSEPTTDERTAEPTDASTATETDPATDSQTETTEEQAPNTPRETGTPTETPTPGDTPTATDTPTPTATPTPTPRPTPSVSDTAFSLTDRGCGSQTHEATITFDESETAVDVSGTIWGNNGCYIATLQDATYDPEADTLTVEVKSKTEDSEETKACTQCIAEVDYETTVSFEGTLPGTVVVSHVKGLEKTTAARKSRSE